MLSWIPTKTSILRPLSAFGKTATSFLHSTISTPYTRFDYYSTSDSPGLAPPPITPLILFSYRTSR